MNLSQKAFTLLELLVTIAIIGTLAAIALPSIADMISTSKYKEAARGIASTLQDARAQAVALNLEHQVVFEVGQKRYQLKRGDKASNSGVWTPVFSNWITFKPGVEMRGTTACDSTAVLTIHFNPNGTAQPGYICVMDVSLNEKFKVGVASSTTGRVVTDP